MEKRNQKQGGGARPFLFGALLSGGLALLFTPQAGAELRSRLQQTLSQWQGQASEMTSQAKQQAQQVAGQVQQQASTVQQKVQQVAGQAQQAAGQATEQAQQTAQQVKEQAQQTGQQVKEQAQQTAQQVKEQGQQAAQQAASQAGGQTQSTSTSGQARAAAEGPLSVTTESERLSSNAATGSTPPPRSSGGAATGQAARIQEHMAVVGANNEPIGKVDRLDAGDTIKLTKDAQGRHHWIPLKWVASVTGDQVRLSRAAQQVQREWLSNPPRQGR